MTTTQYFNMVYPGHGGGDFFLLNCALHPQPMTVFLEIFKEEMLRFEERGLDRKTDYDSEILRAFEFRKGKDVCVGNLKCEHPAVIEYVETHGGRVFHVIRNPIALIGMRFGRKNEEARRGFQKLYGRPASTDTDLFEGTVLKYKKRFHKMYLDRGPKWPTVRLEDINYSIGRDAGYFKRFMEWATQVEWPEDYINHIRLHHTPGHAAESRAVFDEDGNLLKLNVWPRFRWREKIGRWDREDQSAKGAAAFWDSWPDEWKKRYQLHYEELDERMGYNQDHPGSTDDAWEQEGRFGDV